MNLENLKKHGRNAALLCAAALCFLYTCDIPPEHEEETCLPHPVPLSCTTFDRLRLEAAFTGLPKDVPLAKDFVFLTPCAQKAHFSVQLDVQPIFQHDVSLPNGCEAVSMAMLMRYHGVPADPYDFAMNDLPRSDILQYGQGRFAPDPEKEFIGDPSDPYNGWYCFEDPLIKGANAYFKRCGIALRAQKFSGRSTEDLFLSLAAGHPAAVWLTTDYTPPRRNPKLVFMLPDGRRYRPYRNAHCLVLTGADESLCYLSDPLLGRISIPKDRFESLYNAMGKRAVILLDSVPR